jgi:hypothetical protein
MLNTMTVLAAFAALALATSAGYYWGRRARCTPSPWKKRTSRMALGRRAVNLVVLVAARRIERRLRTGPLRILAPLGLLRGSVTRMRAYRGAPGW